MGSEEERGKSEVREVGKDEGKGQQWLLILATHLIVAAVWTRDVLQSMLPPSPFTPFPSRLKTSKFGVLRVTS